LLLSSRPRLNPGDQLVYDQGSKEPDDRLEQRRQIDATAAR